MAENIITFSDLDNMINVWAIQLQEYQNVFANQVEEIKRTFWVVGFHNEKLNELSYKLAVLNYLTLQLEAELEYVNHLHHMLEQKLSELEKIVVVLQEKDPVDAKRYYTYGITENLNSLLKNYADNVDIVSQKIRKDESGNKQDPVQQIADIMTKFLEKLEWVEVNTEYIKNQLLYVECIKNSILQSRTSMNIRR